MKNYVYSGDTLTAVAPRALSSGDGFLLGSLFGVAAGDAESGAVVVAKVAGVFTLKKTASQVWTQGQVINWDDSTHACTTGAGTLIGTAAEAALSADVLGNVRLNSGYYPAIDEGVMRSVDVTLTATQVKALNATPITAVAAPGAGKAIVPLATLWFLDYGTVAYDGIAGGEDLTLKYTNASGAVLQTVETTGFLDATADALRYQPCPTTVSTPVENAAVVIHMATGEIATGDSPLKVRVYYRVVPTVL